MFFRMPGSGVGGDGGGHSQAGPAGRGGLRVRQSRGAAGAGLPTSGLPRPAGGVAPPEHPVPGAPSPGSRDSLAPSFGEPRPSAPFLCSGGWLGGAAAGLGPPLSRAGRRSPQWLPCSSRCSSTLTLVSTFRRGGSPGSSLSLPARLSSGQPAGTWLPTASTEAQGGPSAHEPRCLPLPLGCACPQGR